MKPPTAPAKTAVKVSTSLGSFDISIWQVQLVLQQNNAVWFSFKPYYLFVMKWSLDLFLLFLETHVIFMKKCQCPLPITLLCVNKKIYIYVILLKALWKRQIMLICIDMWAFDWFWINQNNEVKTQYKFKRKKKQEIKGLCWAVPIWHFSLQRI